jgi:two-component system chemotaxis sensor kinase CheA
VTLILSSIDRIKEILAGLEATEAEPEGNDRDLIDQLEAMVERGMAAMAAGDAGRRRRRSVPVVEAPPVQADMAEGTLVVQTLERPLRPGEVSLDELERAFRETATEVVPRRRPQPAAKAGCSQPPPPRPAEARQEAGPQGRRRGRPGRRQDRQPGRSGSTSTPSNTS